MCDKSLEKNGNKVFSLKRILYFLYEPTNNVVRRRF